VADTPTTDRVPHVTVQNLDMAYGDFVIQRNLNFTIYHGDIFIIMGGSGCGKSTLLKHLVGLKAPARGEVRAIKALENIISRLRN
jgi:phospholipid/cholesterol/gamma-HCH transport system ATP-binding protein